MKTNDNAVMGLIFAVTVLALIVGALFVRQIIIQIPLNKSLIERVSELERIVEIQVRINDDLLAAMVNVGSISYEIFQRYTTPPERIER